LLEISSALALKLAKKYVMVILEKALFLDELKGKLFPVRLAGGPDRYSGLERIGHKAANLTLCSLRRYGCRVAVIPKQLKHRDYVTV
jgi:hypothetical protein